MIYPSPLLKWLGGKSKLLDSILPLLPTRMRHYYEPFVGGGSVLLAILALSRTGAIHISGNIYASDNNRALIQFYKTVQTHPRPLFKTIRTYFDTYDNIPVLKKTRTTRTNGTKIHSKEEYYYWLRDCYCNETHKQSIRKSALFYVLNKLDFRGMYRESRSGTFNVSFGHYQKAPLCNETEFLKVSEYLQPVHFTHCSFQKAISSAGRGDVVYLDPPYVPEQSSSFVTYTSDGFHTNVHHALFESLHHMQHRGVRFLMSNADVDYVRSRVQSFHTRRVIAKRAIHCKKPQTTTPELLIHNISQSRSSRVAHTRKRHSKG